VPTYGFIILFFCKNFAESTLTHGRHLPRALDEALVKHVFAVNMFAVMDLLRATHGKLFAVSKSGFRVRNRLTAKSAFPVVAVGQVRGRFFIFLIAIPLSFETGGALKVSVAATKKCSPRKNIHTWNPAQGKNQRGRGLLGKRCFILRLNTGCTLTRY
jgi:hypothetical protein